jgi:hypothetical protein
VRSVGAGDAQGAEMDGQWLTYSELADRLGVSVQAARRRVLRSRWSRQRGNDGKARVLLPSDVEVEPAPARRHDSASDADAHGAATIAALESHIKTLQEELATERERSGAQLAAARADLAAEWQRAAALLAAEQARTTQAIAAFEQLAVKLEAIAEARRPWWRRLHMTG